MRRGEPAERGHLPLGPVEYAHPRERVHLVLRSNNDARIKAAVLFAERLFEGESFVVHEKDPTGELRIPLRPPNCIATVPDTYWKRGQRIDGELVSDDAMSDAPVPTATTRLPERRRKYPPRLSRLPGTNW